MFNAFISRRRFIAAASCALASIRAQKTFAAALKPSGRIAFVRGSTLGSSQRKIWLINPDGSDLKPLTSSPDNAGEDRPAWSPDGKSIARSVNNRIATSSVEGQNTVLLTPDTFDAADPCWSPDGKRLAFYAWHDDRKSSHIYVVNTDGTKITQLTHGQSHNWMPSWSSDNRHIIFESTRDGNREIYSITTDGKNAVNLTHHKSTDHSPACSPKTTQIALMSGQNFGNAEICVMKDDGSELTNLTNHPARDSEPTWAANGEWLAFTRFDMKLKDSPMNIYIMKADGTQVSNVTRSKGPIHNWAPAWH